MGARPGAIVRAKHAGSGCPTRPREFRCEERESPGQFVDDWNVRGSTGPGERVEVDRDDPLANALQCLRPIAVLQRNHHDVRSTDSFRVHEGPVGGEPRNTGGGRQTVEARNPLGPQAAGDRPYATWRPVEKVHLDLEAGEGPRYPRHFAWGQCRHIPVDADDRGLGRGEPLRGSPNRAASGRDGPFAEQVVERLGPAMGDETFRNHEARS